MLQKLAENFPAVVVSGARQVGKSTLVKHVFGQEADYVLFDSIMSAENARREPDLFLNSHPNYPLILDEIQYAPELVSAIKRRIDREKKPRMYILTGSQQWAVMKNISDSLAGRVVFVDLDGFCLHETLSNRQPSWIERFLNNSQEFISSEKTRLDLNHTLNETIWRGFLPEATMLPLEVIKKFHDAYMLTYIERDARLFADISDWHLFGRFVRLVAALSAQEINYSQIGRELGLSPQTARSWLMILKATFQWFEIYPYSRNTIKRLSKKSKGYFADTGIICSAHEIMSPNSLSVNPLWGAIFETAVANEIRKHLSMMGMRYGMYHWRTLRGAEADVLIERNGIFYPVEIKAASNPTRNDTSGITAFRKTYPELRIAPGLVICPCERFYRISENDYALPWDTA